jgi:tetratricopeptide (TPR) repeat protein
VKLLVLEMKKAEGAVIEADSQMLKYDVVAKRREALDAVKQVVLSLADKMATRQQLSVSGLIFLGDTCGALLANARAREVYQRALATVDKDPAAKESAGKATTRVRAQLISLLRNEGKYDEATKQVDALLVEHPNALEPLMEKGLILQAWAQRDPKRYDECIAHWTNVRVLLGRMKTRPPEYYDVLYHAASCLLAQAKATKDPAKALQAEQMMKSTLTLSPKLNGPDTVARYTALAAEAAKFQGRTTPTDAKATTKPPEQKP